MRQFNSLQYPGVKVDCLFLPHFPQWNSKCLLYCISLCYRFLPPWICLVSWHVWKQHQECWGFYYYYYFWTTSQDPTRVEVDKLLFWILLVFILQTVNLTGCFEVPQSVQKLSECAIPPTVVFKAAQYNHLSKCPKILAQKAIFHSMFQESSVRLLCSKTKHVCDFSHRSCNPSLV